MAFVSMLAPRRSCADITRFLNAYEEFRAENPLPADWAEDRLDVLAAVTDPDHEPVLRFERAGWKGSVRVEVDLYYPGSVAFWVDDTSGEPMDSEQFVDLMRVLLGDLLDLDAALDGQDEVEAGEDRFLPPTEYDPDAPDDEPEAYCRVQERPR